MEENVKVVESETINKGKALADYISCMDYGTIIHYQEIEKVTGRQRKTPLYYRDISKAKSLLEKEGKAIASIGAGDYQVLYPGDYSNAYAKEVKAATRRIKHGGKILDGAPVNDMTTEERSTYNGVYDFHKRLEASVQGEFVTVKRLTNKKHPLLANNDEV